jgi:hypothetical protein
MYPTNLEVTLTGAVRSRTHRNIPRLNSKVFAASVLLVGLVSFVIGLVDRNDSSSGTVMAAVATGTGLYGVFVGLLAQMMSTSRAERVLIVTGMIGGFIGLAIGLAHGTLS